jgi:hypothetical protein
MRFTAGAFGFDRWRLRCACLPDLLKKTARQPNQNTKCTNQPCAGGKESGNDGVPEATTGGRAQRQSQCG